MAVTWSRTRDDRAVIRADGAAAAIVPRDPGNVDYQEFLAWAAAGGDPGPIPALPAPSLEDTNRTTLLDQMRAAWTDLGTYLALGTASTAAQDKAALRLLCRIARWQIRVMISKLDGTD